MDNTLIYVFITNSLVQLICYRFFFDTDTSEMWTLNSSPLVSISRKFNRIKYLESSVKSLVQNPERSELFVLNFASLASAASFWVSFQGAKDDFVSFITGSRGVGERWGSRSGKSCRAHFRLEDHWNIALCSSRVMLGALWKLPTPVPYFSAWLSCYMGTWPRSGRPSQEIINRTLLWSLAKHASSPTSSLHLCCRSDLYSSDKKSAWPLKLSGKIGNY